MFQPGDRVRWSTDSDDGLPWTRYGFVGALSRDGFANVMFDGELKSSTQVPIHELEPVTITSVELCLDGSDLLDDPSLRSGLVALWSAEADEAGLEIDQLSQFVAVGGAPTSVLLAEVQAGGSRYLLHASASAARNHTWVRAVPGG